MSWFRRYSIYIYIVFMYLLMVVAIDNFSKIWSIAIMTLLFISTVLFLFYFNKKKDYFKDIINQSPNIVLVSDREKILFANETFFHYFKGYKNIDEFLRKHTCICDFFEEEEGYITQINKGVRWIDYLLENKWSYHKAKIQIYKEIYYFSISVSVLDEENDLYGVIMSDITEQERYKKELESLAIKDTLTGIGNRRYFHQKLDEQILFTQRYNNPFSLIIFDVDFFKKVNDNYGHDIGDQVLIEYTKYIASMLRDTDIFCRIGGEEFIVILPNTTKDKAYILAQKLREKVENYKKVLPITMSFGVTGYEKGDDDISIYKRVDVALYKAKETGRNKVVLG